MKQLKNTEVIEKIGMVVLMLTVLAFGIVLCIALKNEQQRLKAVCNKFGSGWEFRAGGRFNYNICVNNKGEAKLL